jgi:hypothetical protein
MLAKVGGVSSCTHPRNARSEIQASCPEHKGAVVAQAPAQRANGEHPRQITVDVRIVEGFA